MKNKLFINHKIWNNYTEEELDNYKLELFNYYRENGFPYFKLNKDEINKIVYKLKILDTNTLLLEDDKLKQIMLGLNLVNFYMPHMWMVECNNFTSPMMCFNDDTKLKKTIDKRIKFGSNMSDAGMRKVLSWTHGTHRVSNFRPSIAKYIYDNYSGDGNVLDFSSGFGGRLLGSICSDKVSSYTGVEPSSKTFEYLNKIKNDLSEKEIILHNEAFEDLNLEENKYDLSFSSPPYFNTEEYAYEDTQSFMRYKTKEEWRDNFLKVTIQKNYKYIKKGGYFIINVANVKTYKELEKDTISLCLNEGFKYVKTYKMSLSSLMKKGFKYEPIFIFKKVV